MNRHFNLKARIHDWYRKHNVKEIAFALDKNPKTLGNEINEWSPNKHDLYDLLDAVEFCNDLEPLDLILERFHSIRIALDQYNGSEESIVRGMASTISALGVVGDRIEKAIQPESKGGESITKEEWNEIVSAAFNTARQLLSFVYLLRKHQYTKVSKRKSRSLI